MKNDPFDKTQGHPEQSRTGEKLKIIKPGRLVSALIFAFGIFGVSMVTSLAATSKAANKIVITPSPMPTPILFQVLKVDYYLAYPGILPDHMFYSIKMIRDRIALFLTTDPAKKAEKLLLYADKRLGAAKVLIEGNKEELGLSTMTKGEKYLEQAIAQAQKVNQRGKETENLYEKLTKAALKHKEVLEEIAKRVPESSKGQVMEILNYSSRGYEQLIRMKGETE